MYLLFGVVVWCGVCVCEIYYMAAEHRGSVVVGKVERCDEVIWVAEKLKPAQSRDGNTVFQKFVFTDEKVANYLF